MSNQISAETKKLIDSYREMLELEKNYDKTDEERIKVHQVSSRLAFLYEKIRNTVDYQEEYLLRKSATERILKRRLMTEKNEFDVAKFLIYELIRARYLPNDKIPQKRIDDVKEIIEKYTLLINKIPRKIDGKETDIEYLYDWITGIAACEIEEKIVPYKKESAMVEFACQSVNKKLKVPKRLMNQQDKEIQIYIAVLRNLTKSDIPLIRYKLFKMQYPSWFFAPSEESITRMAQNINRIVEKIEKQINHPLSENFSNFVKKNLAYFIILQDVISNNIKTIDKIFSYHLYLEDAIKEACLREYKEAKTKLRRAAVRSILYIFITKMILAFIIELPFDKYILGHINYVALGINVAFPPLLMLLVAATIKVPSKKNTKLIVSGIKEMVYGKYSSPPIIMKGILSRSSFFSKIFIFFYMLVFIASFGIIVWVLRKINFNVMSIIIFLFFLSVVSYFGMRISRNVRELVVVQRKEGIITFITDLFSIPILQMGQWLSIKLSNVNVFVFVLDFIIEAPFKTFVEIFEEWIYFIKEEREKIY